MSPSGGFSRYSPILRSMATYSALYPASNLTQQLIGHKGRLEEVDFKQVARFFIYGGFIHANIVFQWLAFIGKTFPSRTPLGIAKIVLVDQVFFAPVALTSFYGGLSTMEGKSIQEIKEELKVKVPKTWATAVFYWPFVQAFNFRYVPARNRTVVVGMASFFWTVGLSFYKNQKVESSDSLTVSSRR